MKINSIGKSFKIMKIDFQNFHVSCKASTIYIMDISFGSLHNEATIVKYVLHEML